MRINHKKQDDGKPKYWVFKVLADNNFPYLINERGQFVQGLQELKLFNGTFEQAKIEAARRARIFEDISCKTVKSVLCREVIVKYDPNMKPANDTLKLQIDRLNEAIDNIGKNKD